MIGEHSKQEREEFDRLAASMSDERIYNHAFNGWLAAKRASVGDSNSVELHQISLPKLGFLIDPPGDRTRVLRWDDGSCRPAEGTEIAMWDALQWASVGSAEPMNIYLSKLRELAEAAAKATEGSIPYRTSALHVIAAELTEMIESIESAPPSSNAKDAERWRETLFHVGGRNANGGQQFTLSFLSPIKGRDIMRGSAAGHFTDAIDAAIAVKDPS